MMNNSSSHRPTPDNLCFSVRDLSISYGNIVALENVSLNIFNQKITALIGPSGCGKTSFLRCLNRMNDLYKCEITGQVLLDGQNIYDKDADVISLRANVGMVFQKAIPFPRSIYDNVGYGLDIHNLCQDQKEKDQIIRDSLDRVGLLSEVRDRLDSSALKLSGGQQQRLCIARAIAIKPKVLLMDEPCSALDPIATSQVEELIYSLKENYTIVIVTHSMAQAARISDRTAFFHMGKIVEENLTKVIFNNPKLQKTQDYITGRIG